MSALDDAIERVRDKKERIAGHLTLTVPLVGYHFLNDNIGTFLCAHSEVDIEVRFSDAMVDLVAEGIDLGIRNGPLRDSSLKQRRFGPFYHGLFASPDYLNRRGEPQFANLEGHDRIAYRFSMTGQLQPWRAREGSELALSPPRIIVNAIEGARSGTPPVRAALRDWREHRKS
ncbi:LysR substrate-binding domain-containing protein [Rhizobium sp. C4]|uniref:LysR substrate-binding domain-containing protein n=1 Tax=Rhizobium sp. C4 TaxID=1349800 RepID=UPI001E5AD322|nr:LysR substrate-binding domain-containing protein [Rhizobium sp. C4]MCD2175014.1 LysR substrate-binding domain-containing protein [Rhizobium sp. C4]